MTQTKKLEQFDFIENQLEKNSVNVHKFGGSSLASPQCIERVVAIIRQHCQLNDVIVVSASGKTTDLLLSLYQFSLEKKSTLTTLTLLKEQQKALIFALLNQTNAARLALAFQQEVTQLELWLTQDPAAFESDILSLGELWSARLLATILNERLCASYYLDARDFLVINNARQCLVDSTKSKALLKDVLQAGKLAVITGYICKDSDGINCTLGRNGSDYSATRRAAGGAAKKATVWTEVDGI